MFDGLTERRSVSYTTPIHFRTELQGSLTRWFRLVEGIVLDYSLTWLSRADPLTQYKFLKQVVCQAKGFSNNSRIDYSEIKLPGRSEVAMEMMWIKMKAEIIVAKMVMVASKTGTAAAKSKFRIFN